MADGLSFINADYSGSHFRVSRVAIGVHNFLGNRVAYPAQGRTGDDCLLATKVMVPLDGPVGVDIEVVAEAADGSEGLERAEEPLPDVALIDIQMPVMDGIEATRQITAAPDPPKVLILTTFELDEYVFNALQAGASGFLLKRSPPEQLLEGIRTVAAGEGLLSPSVTRRLIERFSSRPARTANPRFADMTDREREVLVLVAQGLSNQQIADSLVISERTARTHVSNILSKLGVASRTQAALLAIREGIAPAS